MFSFQSSPQTLYTQIPVHSHAVRTFNHLKAALYKEEEEEEALPWQLRLPVFKLNPGLHWLLTH